MVILKYHSRLITKSDNSASAEGGKKLLLFTEGKDVEVHFLEDTEMGKKFIGKAEITSIFKTTGLSVKVPYYRLILRIVILLTMYILTVMIVFIRNNITEPKKCYMALYGTEFHEYSEPVEFTYLPLNYCACNSPNQTKKYGKRSREAKVIYTGKMICIKKTFNLASQ